MNIGQKIQKLRKKTGLSQEQLAEKLSVSRQAVSNWELAECLPDTDNIVQLSQLFGVSTDYLLHDAIDSEEQLPAVIAKADQLAKQHNAKMLFTLCLGIMTIGFLVAYLPLVIINSAMFSAAFYGNEYQAPTNVLYFSRCLGLLIQLACIIVYRALTIKNMGQNSKYYLRRFYSFSIWLVLPVLASALGMLNPISLLLTIIGTSNSILISLVNVGSYLAVCGIISGCLHQDNKVDIEQKTIQLDN